MVLISLLVKQYSVLLALKETYKYRSCPAILPMFWIFARESEKVVEKKNIATGELFVPNGTQ